MAPNLRPQFRNRERLFGAWTSFGHPSITEIFCQSGFQFVGIDIEHSTINLEQSQQIIATCQSFGLPCYPRVGSHNGEQIRRLLDAGADGVIVPMVNNLKEVEQLVNWIKYPPVGKRSFGVARAQSYGAKFESYVKDWNERAVFIPQIESIEGVKAIDEIVSHPHVDGVMVGPYDMSGSLGIPGQLFHPDVTQACQTVIQACQKHNKSCGTQVIEPNDSTVQAAFDQGYTFSVLASDVFLMWKWGEQMKQLMRSYLQKTKW